MNSYPTMLVERDKLFKLKNMSEQGKTNEKIEMKESYIFGVEKTFKHLIDNTNDLFEKYWYNPMKEKFITLTDIDSIKVIDLESVADEDGGIDHLTIQKFQPITPERFGELLFFLSYLYLRYNYSNTQKEFLFYVICSDNVKRVFSFYGTTDELTFNDSDSTDVDSFYSSSPDFLII